MIPNEMLWPELERYAEHQQSCPRCTRAYLRKQRRLEIAGPPRNQKEVMALVKYIMSAMCKEGRILFTTAVDEKPN